MEEEIKEFPEQTTFNEDDMSIVYDEEEVKEMTDSELYFTNK